MTSISCREAYLEDDRSVRRGMKPNLEKLYHFVAAFIEPNKDKPIFMHVFKCEKTMDEVVKKAKVDKENWVKTQNAKNVKVYKAACKKALTEYHNAPRKHNAAAQIEYTKACLAAQMTLTERRANIGI